MLIAMLLAMLSGALLAALVCKAIELKLWLDLAAGAGGIAALVAASRLAGAESWPLFGLPVGFLGVVGYLKYWRAA